jgi:hypothetical protein
LNVILHCVFISEVIVNLDRRIDVREQRWVLPCWGWVGVGGNNLAGGDSDEGLQRLTQTTNSPLISVPWWLTITAFYAGGVSYEPYSKVCSVYLPCRLRSISSHKAASMSHLHPTQRLQILGWRRNRLLTNSDNFIGVDCMFGSLPPQDQFNVSCGSQ